MLTLAKLPQQKNLYQQVVFREEKAVLDVLKVFFMNKSADVSSKRKDERKEKRLDARSFFPIQRAESLNEAKAKYGISTTRPSRCSRL